MVPPRCLKGCPENAHYTRIINPTRNQPWGPATLNRPYSPPRPGRLNGKRRGLGPKGTPYTRMLHHWAAEGERAGRAFSTVSKSLQGGDHLRAGRADSPASALRDSGAPRERAPSLPLAPTFLLPAVRRHCCPPASAAGTRLARPPQDLWLPSRSVRRDARSAPRPSPAPPASLRLFLFFFFSPLPPFSPPLSDLGPAFPLGLGSGRGSEGGKETDGGGGRR